MPAQRSAVSIQRSCLLLPSFAFIVPYTTSEWTNAILHSSSLLPKYWPVMAHAMLNGMAILGNTRALRSTMMTGTWFNRCSMAEEGDEEGSGLTHAYCRGCGSPRLVLREARLFFFLRWHRMQVLTVLSLCTLLSLCLACNAHGEEVQVATYRRVDCPKPFHREPISCTAPSAKRNIGSPGHHRDTGNPEGNRSRDASHFFGQV